MYAALADRAQAVTGLDQVAGIVDDAVTRTYVTAFILTR